MALTFSENVDAKDSVAPTFSSSPEIISVTYFGTNISLFINGMAKTLSTANGTMKEAGGYSFIGSINGGQTWLGKISEIIVFNRKLNIIEQRSVEDYLSKKYSIKVS